MAFDPSKHTQESQEARDRRMSPVSEGKHVAVISLVSASPSKNSGNEMVRLDFEILSNKDGCQGKEIIHNYFVELPEGARGYQVCSDRIYWLWVATGKPEGWDFSSQSTMSAALYGAAVMVTVKHERDDRGVRAKVDHVGPLSEAQRVKYPVPDKYRGGQSYEGLSNDDIPF